MILFDGTYRWPASGEASKTRKDWAFSCSLRIIDLSADNPDINYLKPLVVIATETSRGPYRTTCAESMGKRIFRDFKMDVDKTLWIESRLDDPDQMIVGIFKPKSHAGYETYYSIAWRPILPNEFELIKPFIT
jgi:hypothetical protein